MRAAAPLPGKKNVVCCCAVTPRRVASRPPGAWECKGSAATGGGGGGGERCVCEWGALERAMEAPQGGDMVVPHDPQRGKKEGQATIAKKEPPSLPASKRGAEPRQGVLGGGALLPRRAQGWVAPRTARRRRKGCGGGGVPSSPGRSLASTISHLMGQAPFCLFFPTQAHFFSGVPTTCGDCVGGVNAAGWP